MIVREFVGDKVVELFFVLRVGIVNMVFGVVVSRGVRVYFFNYNMKGIFSRFVDVGVVVSVWVVIKVGIVVEGGDLGYLKDGWGFLDKVGNNFVVRFDIVLRFECGFFDI